MNATYGNTILDTVVRGGTVVTPGFEAQTDVGIRDGRIAQVGGVMTAAREIDARGKFVLPGGIDAHVHLTAPGTGPGAWRWVDDFAVGTRAAAAGGITTVGNMSFPRADEQMMAGLERDLVDAEANALVDYFMHPVLMDPSDEGIRQIEPLAATGHPSIKIFMSFRRFDRHADRYLRAMRAARDAGAMVMIHCEDPAVMGCCAEMLTESGRTEPRWFPETRPITAERIATERAVGFCETTRASTYIVHLSSAAALDACRAARARGLPLHVETRPIYLHLEQSRFADLDGAKYAGAPPLRTDDDRNRLWHGINDGTVSTVCTDHAPWTLEDKLDPSLTAVDLRHGMAELETMLPVLWSEGVAKGRLSVSRFVEVTSTNAARLFGLYPRKGTIAPGADADLVIWDPDAVRSVDGSLMQSRAGYSPYDGWLVQGWPALTISRGEVVARLDEGDDGDRARMVVEGQGGRGMLAFRARQDQRN